MADTLALENLYATVTALMAAENPACAQHFGWREARRQFAPKVGDPHRRIVWIPGDENGGAGEWGGPRYPGELPARGLANVAELFHVRLTAADPADPEDEALQYRAVTLLRDDWLRAVYLSAYGTYSIRSLRWDVSKTERRYGTSLIIVGVIQSKVIDGQLDVAPADTHAAISSAVLEVIELSTVP